MVEVSHPGKAAPTKAQLKERLASLYKVADPSTIVLFGFKTGFGGGKTTGFALIYDAMKDVKRFEPRFRLRRAGLGQKKEGTRKSKKERKNRAKKVRGKEKAKALKKDAKDKK